VGKGGRTKEEGHELAAEVEGARSEEVKGFPTGSAIERNWGKKKSHSSSSSLLTHLSLFFYTRWLTAENGQVAIYDATNSTVERRKMILKECGEAGVEVFFIESICSDPEIIMSNIKEVKVSSPDYRGKKSEEIVGDFMERIKHYEGSQTPLFLFFYYLGQLVMTSLTTLLLSFQITTRPLARTMAATSS